MIDDLTFSADNETLSGCVVRSTRSSVPKLLFLHGAGQSTKERALPLAEHLSNEYDITSFLFDFSGHGASSGNIQNSSLTKRAREAQAAIQAAELPSDFSVCAFSMGAHVALSLIDIYSITSINLFYPAVYPPEAENLLFGAEFSAAIRRQNAWHQSRCFEALSRFDGSLLVTIGERDEVIPGELPQMLINSARNASKKELVVVPGGTHMLLPTILGSDTLLREIGLRVFTNCSNSPRS